MHYAKPASQPVSRHLLAVSCSSKLIALACTSCLAPPAALHLQMPAAMKKSTKATKAGKGAPAKTVKKATKSMKKATNAKGAGKGVLVNQPGTLGKKLSPGFYGRYKSWYLGPAGGWWKKSLPPWDLPEV